MPVSSVRFHTVLSPIPVAQSDASGLDAQLQRACPPHAQSDNNTVTVALSLMHTS